MEKGKGKSRETSLDSIEMVQADDVFFNRVGAGEGRRSRQIIWRVHGSCR